MNYLQLHLQGGNKPGPLHLQYRPGPTAVAAAYLFNLPGYRLHMDFLHLTNVPALVVVPSCQQFAPFQPRSSHNSQPFAGFFAVHMHITLLPSSLLTMAASPLCHSLRMLSPDGHVATSGPFCLDHASGVTQPF